MDTELFGVKEFPVENLGRGFAGAAIIKGMLNFATNTTYHIYDALGREIAAPRLTTGVYFIKISGEPLYKIVKIE
ncbi:hypothetical protein JXB22_02390 [candidate division WOR-3 bacterium]|nr:hypothetical protein [candidate division WOR-3 bacterium]